METYGIILLCIFINLLFMFIFLYLVCLTKLDEDQNAWFTVQYKVIQNVESRKTPTFFHPVYVYYISDGPAGTYPLYKDNSVTVDIAGYRMHIIGTELPTVSTTAYANCQTVCVGKRTFICGQSANVPDNIPDKNTFLIYTGYAKEAHKKNSDLLIGDLSMARFVRRADAYSWF